MSVREAKIAEIFKSIQGEGPYQGQEQIFIRFFGCNLKCEFCDTKLTTYQEKTEEEVLVEVDSLGDCKTVSLTGGEPLLQVNFLKGILKPLKKRKKVIYLETNGTLYENLSEVIDWVDLISMDFKLPSSTKDKDCWSQHERFFKIAKEKEVFVKAVITEATEVQDIYRAIELIKTLKPDTPFILQPEYSKKDIVGGKLINFSDICQGAGLNVGMLGQLHKVIGVK